VASPPPLLRPVAALLASWQAGREPVAPRTVPAREAVGLVLAEDLVAPRALPERATALRAGYAVAAADLVGVSAYAPRLLPEAPRFVEAGDPLPPGADAVLPPDALVKFAAGFEILSEVAPGENVRRIGEDLGAGDRLRAAGEVLRPRDAGVARAAGIDAVSVRPFTLGLAGAPPVLEWMEGLATSFRSGMRIAILPFRSDDAEDRETTLKSSAADLILVLGRPTPALAERLAASEAPQAVALAGAEAALIGGGATPLILAPPRIEALVALLLGLIDPYAAALTGRAPRRVWRRARLTRKIASAVGLTEVVLLRETKGGLEPVSVGSITVNALAEAEGFLVLPPDSEGLADGTEVEAYAL
jgi:molybdopterin molybdotransferase